MSQNDLLADVFATIKVYMNLGTSSSYDEDVDDILNQLFDRVLFTKFDVIWYNRANKKKMNHCHVTITDREKRKAKVKWSQ